MTAISDLIILCDIYSYKFHKFHAQILILIWAVGILFLIFIDFLMIISACFLLLKRSRSLASEEEEEKFRTEKKWFWMHAANLALMIITIPFEVISWQEKIYLSKNISIVVDLIKMFTAINLSIIFVLRASVRSKIFNDYKELKQNLTVSITNLNLAVVFWRNEPR